MQTKRFSELLTAWFLWKKTVYRDDRLSGERLPSSAWTKHGGIVASFCHVLGFQRVLVCPARQKSAATLFMLSSPCAWGHCLCMRVFKT